MFGPLIAPLRQLLRHRREGQRRAALDRTDAAALAGQAAPAAGRLLVLRTDSIGDYLLFRPWLRVLAQAARGRGQRLTLLANALWAPLAQAWDADCFDELLPVEMGRFGRDLSYRAEVLARVGAGGYGAVLGALHVRDPAAENFVRLLHAQVRVTSQGAHQPGPWFETLNTGYTSLLPSARAVRHEYVRNGELVQNWQRWQAGEAPAPLPDGATDEQLAAAWQATAPLALPAAVLAAGAAEATAGEPYLVLFAGASASQKQWPARAFGQLAQQLYARYGGRYRLVLAGSPADVPLGEAVARAAGPAVPLDNRCGRTDLPALAALLAGASLVVSNDTAAAHLAAQAGVPLVVTLMGENYGKFFPYPPALLRAPCRCLLPPSQEARLARGNYRIPRRDPDIRKITVARVLAAAVALLDEKTAPTTLRP